MDKLADTSIVVALLRGDPGIEQRLEGSGDFFLSVVVLGELLLGALGAREPEREKGKVLDFVRGWPVLHCDQETAEKYAAMKFLLRQRGTPVPENDLWIAATARAHGLTVATRDRHFEVIPDLQLERW